MSADEVLDTPPLLRLTSNLRLRIYSYTAAYALGWAGNGWQKFINLNNPGARDHHRDRESFVTTYRLLLTCRTIYEDVSPMVYANNHFFIGFGDHRNLEGIRSLRPASLNALTLLTIHLNVASCGLGRPCKNSLERWEEPSYGRCDETSLFDEPLRMDEAAARVSRLLSGSHH